MTRAELKRKNRKIVGAFPVQPVVKDLLKSFKQEKRHANGKHQTVGQALVCVPASQKADRSRRENADAETDEMKASESFKRLRGRFCRAPQRVDDSAFGKAGSRPLPPKAPQEAGQGTDEPV